mmetsp:Transcript_54186/g.131119  ORF Transcript_54186/g.131119 Transcript_54186/m.131119 type:complete len:283 (-) Transcript_54186:416-1264(-)
MGLEATRAVTAMNGQMLGSKPIYVALHQPIEIRRQMQQAQTVRQPQMLPRFQMQGGMVPPQIPMGFPGRPGPGQVFMFPQQMGGPGGQQFRGQPYRGQGYQQGMGGQQGQGQRRQAGAQGYQQGQQGAQRTGQQGQQQRAGVAPNAGGAQRQQGQQKASGVQMTGQARNMPQQMPAQQAGAAPQQQAASNIPPSSMTKEQLMQMVVNAPPAQAKQILGERLYALIQTEQGPLAGKITGMLLEGLDNSELVALIDDHGALHGKIQEALAALEAHRQQQAQASA